MYQKTYVLKTTKKHYQRSLNPKHPKTLGITSNESLRLQVASNSLRAYH